MRYFVHLVLFLLSLRIGMAQQSFEIILGDEDAYEIIRHSIEYQGNYYSIGARVESGNASAYINRVSAGGEIIQSEWYTKTDTSIFLNFIFPKGNGNLLCIGNAAPVVSAQYSSNLYFREIGEDQSLIRERYDNLPTTNNYTNFTLTNFLITPINEIIIQGVVDTAFEGETDFPFFAKYNFEGERLSYKIYYQFRETSLGEGSELLFNEDSSAFYLIGDLSLPFAYDWAKFDLDFNYLGCGNFPTNESAFTNTPLSVKRLQDGNFIVAHKLYKVGNTFMDGFELRLYNSDFELLNNVVIYDDREVDIPMHKGMGFINEDYIWVATHESQYYQEPTDIKFYLFDANFNLKGSRVYNKDISFWLIDLLPTTDSGCIVSGACDQSPAAFNRDAYLQKVSLSDVVTSSGEQMAVGKEVRLGPVPATDKLMVQTSNEDCTLQLSNMEGRLLSQHKLRQGVNLVGIQQLPVGLYIANVVNNKNNHIENFKIIKQ